MTAGFGATIFAIGIAAWVYSKISRRSNNPKSSLIVAAVVALVAFIIFFTALHTFFKNK